MDDTDAVYVVDDDASVREAVEGLVRSAGLSAKTFQSAQEFLASAPGELPSCLVLDVELPGLSGLDLQQELARADVQIPIIFLTGHGDIPMSVRAMKAGALEFLTKPIDHELLLDAIRKGIAHGQIRREQLRETRLPSAKINSSHLTNAKARPPIVPGEIRLAGETRGAQSASARPLGLGPSVRATAEGIFRKEGEYWTVGYGGKSLSPKGQQGARLPRPSAASSRGRIPCARSGEWNGAASARTTQPNRSMQGFPRGDEDLEKAGIHVTESG